MERDIDSNSREYDSMALSVINNPTATSNQKRISALFSSSSFQRKQSMDSITEIKSEFLNDRDECFSLTSAGGLLTQTEGLIAFVIKLQRENEELKGKQAVSEEKVKHLEVYRVLVSKLQEECNEKNKQLIERDAKLAEKANLIEIMSNRHLQPESSTITQAKFDEKDKLIESLRAEIVKKNHQLQLQSSEIDQLKAVCGSNEAQLNEKMDLITHLKEESIDKDKQIKAMFGRLKESEKNVHDSSKLVDTLQSFGVKCWNQKQYTEALAHFDNAIEIEKMTQNRASKLSELLSSKAACHNRSKQHQQCICAIELALQYDPKNKNALHNRVCAYIILGRYADACQDLENALRLDPTFKKAQDSLKLVQMRTNTSKVQ